MARDIYEHGICRGGGKVCHPAQADAQREAQRMQKVYGGVLSAYPCRLCGAWHVGTTPSGSAPARSRRRARIRERAGGWAPFQGSQ